MSDNKKPRICDVLGVEVGEKWTVDGSAYDATYRISMSGNLQRKGVDGRWRPTNESTVDLVAAIDHPERIRRLHRWTKKDIADAKALKQLWPEASSARKDVFLFGDSEVIVYYVPDAESAASICITSEILPSLLPGETVTLKEILEAENDV